LFLARENRDLQQAQELIDRERAGRNDLYTQDVHAVVLSRRGQHPEAQRIIDGVLAVGVRDPRLLFHGAIIHHAAGNKARAQALLQQLLKQSPHFDVIAEPIAQRLALELAS
jgi:predicted Zn-dependent protease